MPHSLIDGPAGTGKTTFARAIAAEMGTEARIANAPLIRDAVALITLLLSAARGSAIFIDEIHALPVRLMELLHEALESGALTLLVTERAEASGLGVTSGAAAMLAGVAHGIPREALGLLVRAHDEAVNEGEGRIDEDTVRRTLAAAGIDHLGLNRSHGLMTTTVCGRAVLPEAARLLHVRTATGMGREAATARRRRRDSVARPGRRGHCGTISRTYWGLVESLP